MRRDGGLRREGREEEESVKVDMGKEKGCQGCSKGKRRQEEEKRKEGWRERTNEINVKEEEVAEKWMEPIR